MHTSHDHRCEKKCLLFGSRFVDMIKRYCINIDRILCRSTGWYMQQSKMQNHFDADRQEAAILIALGFAVPELVSTSLFSF